MLDTAEELGRNWGPQGSSVHPEAEGKRRAGEEGGTSTLAGQAQAEGGWEAGVFSPVS